MLGVIFFSILYKQLVSVNRGEKTLSFGMVSFGMVSFIMKKLVLLIGACCTFLVASTKATPAEGGPKIGAGGAFFQIKKGTEEGIFLRCSKWSKRRFSEGRRLHGYRHGCQQSCFLAATTMENRLIVSKKELACITASYSAWLERWPAAEYGRVRAAALSAELQLWQAGCVMEFRRGSEVVF